MKYISHPELRRKEEESGTPDERNPIHGVLRKAIVLVYRWVTQMKLISTNNAYSGEIHQFRFFYAGQGESFS